MNYEKLVSFDMPYGRVAGFIVDYDDGYEMDEPAWIGVARSPDASVIVEHEIDKISNFRILN